MRHNITKYFPFKIINNHRWITSLFRACQNNVRWDLIFIKALFVYLTLNSTIILKFMMQRNGNKKHYKLLKIFFCDPDCINNLSFFGLPYMSIYYSRCDLWRQSINYWPIMVFKSVCLCTSKSVVNMCTKMTLPNNTLMPYDTHGFLVAKRARRRDLNDIIFKKV